MDKGFKSQEEHEQFGKLLNTLRTGSHAEALTAIEELRDKGWLEDGSLGGQNLFQLAIMGEGGLDLHGADLSRANLGGADLPLADLHGVDLRWADLNTVDLTEANLSGANLLWANLYGADLSGANLRGANLIQANMTEADLSYADLSEARCGNTIFADVDLSRVEGLETLIHESASYVDFHTLQKSNGLIPEVFLRGVGFSDDYLALLPALFGGEAVEHYVCFILYTHADKAFVHYLSYGLGSQVGHCWLVQKDILPGQDKHKLINKRIPATDKFVLVCSQTSLSGDWLAQEISNILEKEKESGQPCLIPVSVDGYLFEAYQGVYGALLRDRLVADFRGWETDWTIFHKQRDRVRAALKNPGA